MKKIFWLMTLFMLIGLYSVCAITVTTGTVDDTYAFTDDFVVSFDVTVGGTTDNISKVELWANLNGSNWNRNQTKYYGNVTGANYTVKFNISNIPDNYSLDYAAIVYVNASYDGTEDGGNGSAYGLYEPQISTNQSAVAYSDNQTIEVHYHPITILIEPTTASWKPNSTNLFKFNVSKNVSAVDYNNGTEVYQCDFYTNQTDSWVVQKSFEVKDTETQNFTHEFVTDLLGVIWNIQCREKKDNAVADFGKVSVNNTINIDSTSPIITAVTNNGSYNNNSNFTINFSIVDTNLQVCKMYSNLNWSHTQEAVPNEFLGDFNDTATMSGENNTRTYSGAQVAARNFTNTFSVPPANNTNYTVNILCNDSAGNSAWAITNLTFIQDQVNPVAPIFSNYSYPGSCTVFALNFTNSREYTNSTLTYNYSGTNVSSDSTGFSRNGTFLIEFNTSYDRRRFLWDVTVCDQAGNCNTSVDNNVWSPLPLCTGYSAYTVTQDRTMKQLANISETGGEILYWFNSTAQGSPWVTFVNGSTSNSGVNLTNGTVVWVYNANASQWDRDVTAVTGIPGWNVSMYAGHNFFGLFQARTAWNLSFTMNQSVPSMNFTWGAVWNNTDQSYASFGHNMTWFNDTLFTPERYEAVWAYSYVNTTYNKTGMI